VWNEWRQDCVRLPAVRMEFGKANKMTHVVPASFALGIALCLAMCLLTLGAHF